MPRRRRSPAAAAATALLPIHTIAPTAVYTAESFRESFGLKSSSLRREVRAGRLRVYKRCNRYFLLGEDILAWLKAGLVVRRPRPEANGTAEVAAS